MAEGIGCAREHVGEADEAVTDVEPSRAGSSGQEVGDGDLADGDAAEDERDV